MQNNIEWKFIEGYGGAYEVSNTGMIKSNHRVNKFGSNILVGKKDKDGYHTVLLVKSGEKKYVRVHRIVAKHFIPNPNNYAVVNHKDANVSNNHVDNLEWCTISYNTKHAYSLGLIISPNKGKFGGLHKCSKTIIKMDLAGNEIERFKGAKEYAKRNNLSVRSFLGVCRISGEYKGFRYKYG